MDRSSRVVLGSNLFPIFFLILFLFGGTAFIRAQAEPVLVEVFERNDCAHCQAERAFLELLAKEHGTIDVRFIDVDTVEGKELFTRFTERYGLSKATPLAVIGTTAVQGFDRETTTGKRLETLVESTRNKERGGIEPLLRSGAPLSEETSGAVCDSTTGICTNPVAEPLYVRIPFTEKTIDVTAYSLPVLAGILGLIDGFNPCAMWVLVTFLLVLVQMGSRSKMWLVAGLFILAETVMYYLILNVWFTTWDFVGLDRIVTPLVGALAIGGGLFFLYEWYFSDGTCQVTDIEERSRISGRIKKLATEPFTWLSALGVVALAFSVNVIEFACSIGIPQAFTKIIEINNLGFFATQGLMALYILFYMIDDFLVFGLALWGFEKIYLTQTYSRWANLVGGTLMLVLGYLLIFHPAVLRLL